MSQRRGRGWLSDTVCHIAVSSGQHCGQIAVAHGKDRYLTTGLPPASPANTARDLAEGFGEVSGEFGCDEGLAAGLDGEGAECNVVTS